MAFASQSALDDDDEFGWDLDAEDEQALCEITDTAFATLSPQRSFHQHNSHANSFHNDDDSGGESDTTITTITTITTVTSDPRPRAVPPPRRGSARLNPSTRIAEKIPGAFPTTERLQTIPDIESIIPDTTAGPSGLVIPRKNGPLEYGPRGNTGKRRAPARNHGGLRRGGPSDPNTIPEEIRYPDLSEAIAGLEPPPEPEPFPPSPRSGVSTINGPADKDQSTEVDNGDGSNGWTPPSKSPLARFRTFPRKTFSVSDFTSAVWCELQHEYTLTHLPGGKKTRTAAMKGGTKLHKKLEDEVHTTVRVEIATKEDAFGLKIWNIVQGLRTLREEGLTREMEVWGLVDGHVVNGIIDGLSTEDPEFDAELLDLPPQQEEEQPQQRITSFFNTTKPHGGPEGKQPELEPPTRKVWLSDVKTRGQLSLPTGMYLRPTAMQLFMYHRFLSRMAARELDYLHVFRRYGMDPDEVFSDVFLAQLGQLHDEIFQDAASTTAPPSTVSKSSSENSKSPSTTPSVERLRYRTLRSLIPLLNEELRLTFPAGAASVGEVVSVEYRYRPRLAEDPDVGRVIGYQRMHVDDEKLQMGLDVRMKWWRGERPAQGVPLDEASKCGYCEFADRCGWRAENHEKVLKFAREKRAADAAARKAEAAEKKAGRAQDLGRKWKKYG